MNCPKCYSKLKTIDSRPSANNQTYRRLECTVCGERYTSTEKITTEEEVTTAPAIDLNDIFNVLAKNSIVRNGYISALTGGIYKTEEEALRDSISELQKLHEKAF